MTTTTQKDPRTDGRGRAGRACAAAAAAAVVAAGLWARAEKTPEAKGPSVEEIVRRTDYVSYYQGRDGRAQVVMTIVDARGKERRREMTILRRDAPPAGAEPAKADRPEAKADRENLGDQKFYVYFREPADVKKTAFLVWKYVKPGKDDDRWLYQPALDNVKRIAATDKRTSFVGSHFFYEDVSGRTITADTHELVKTTDNYYVLRNTPKDPDVVEFAHFDMWIHRKTFVAVRIDYYDGQGKKYRTYQATKVDTIDGYPTVTETKMTDTKIGGHTTLRYKDVTYNIGLPEQLFSERFLKRPPYKFLE